MAAKILGLMAGGGGLPALVAAGARAQGFKVMTVGLSGITDPSVGALSDVFELVDLGKLGAVLQFLQTHHIRQCVMAGAVPKAKLLGEAKLDPSMMGLTAGLGGQLRDYSALRGVATMLEGLGVKVLPLPPFIPEHMAGVGVMGTVQPTEDERADIRYGMAVARATGALDVGQTVVVRRGTVLAVEAVEGTDEAIRRGAALGSRGGFAGKGGVVVCKAVKPHQDLRLDLPTIGPGTVQVCVDVGARVLAVEAERTIVIDRTAALALANEHGLVLVGVPVAAEQGLDGTRA